MTSPLEIVWKNCLCDIKDNIPLHAFKTWFLPLLPIRLENDTLTLQVPSHFFYEWLEEHYLGLLKKVINNVVGPNGKLEYNIVIENNKLTPKTICIPASSKYNEAKHYMNCDLNSSRTKVQNPFIIPGVNKASIKSNLNPSYSFDNFIEGDSNRLALSAGLTVANQPGRTSFNPLFIHGGIGTGKTHLTNAIAIGIKNLHPKYSVLYVGAEKFANEFNHAIKNQRIADFEKYHQLIDVFILDDVHFLSGKEKTQAILFDILNHLHQKGKQIIITADRSPDKLKGITDRLMSRLSWGFSVDIQDTDLETRINILDKKTRINGIQLDSKILEYIACSIPTNLREMEGALTSIIAQATLNKKEITLDFAKQLIDNFVKNTSAEVSIEFVQNIVCEYFDLPIELLKSKTRKREITQARQIAMFFAKRMTKSSLSKIGAHSGGRDHSTVLHACKTVQDLAETDKEFKQYLKDLETKFLFI